MNTSTDARSISSVQVWLGGTIAVGFFLNMTVLYFVTVPIGNKDVLVTLTSTLVNVFLLLVGYFFGSSSASAAKDAALATAATAVAPAPQVTITASALDAAPGAPLRTTIQTHAPSGAATDIKTTPGVRTIDEGPSVSTTTVTTTKETP